MGRDIPPFAAMRAFEALARQGSLRAAGEELAISASAISHQLNALENHLGKKLLYKKDNRIHFTDAGTCLARELGEGLDLLEQASLKASGRRRQNHLSIGMFQSLAELWFVPLLARYHVHDPDTTISVVTGPEFLAGDFDSVDLAIHYGQHIPRGYEGAALLEETVQPLASPAYLTGSRSISNPSAISDHVLIHCSSAADEWETWADQNNISLSGAQRWLEVDTRSAAYQAAEQGLGLAMGRHPMCALALSRKRLQGVFEKSFASGMSYFVVRSENRRHSRQISGLASWLHNIARVDEPFTADLKPPHTVLKASEDILLADLA